MQVLDQQYAAIRRTRGDGNCFFRGFMFSYLVCFIVSSLEAFFSLPLNGYSRLGLGSSE
jgi:hypothetical protein